MITFLIAIACLIIIELLAYNSKFWGIFVVLVGFTAYMWTLTNLWVLFIANLQFIIVSLFAYLILGAIFSVFRFYRYAAKFYKENPKEDKIYDRGNLITGWISWWPFVLIADLLHDPIEALYEYLSTVYDKIEENARIKNKLK